MFEATSGRHMHVPQKANGLTTQPYCDHCQEQGRIIKAANTLKMNEEGIIQTVKRSLQKGIEKACRQEKSKTSFKCPPCGVHVHRKWKKK